MVHCYNNLYTVEISDRLPRYKKRTRKIMNVSKLNCEHKKKKRKTISWEQILEKGTHPFKYNSEIEGMRVDTIHIQSQNKTKINVFCIARIQKIQRFSANTIIWLKQAHFKITQIFVFHYCIFQVLLFQDCFWILQIYYGWRFKCVFSHYFRAYTWEFLCSCWQGKHTLLNREKLFGRTY